MQDFLITSLIASVVLTILINVLPMLFPKSSEKVERKVQEKINESIARQQEGNQPRVRVFFPWKAMLIASLVLTVVVNLIGFFASR